MLVCTSAAGRITPEIGGRIMVRGDKWLVVVVGTARHSDHGKATLVRALAQCLSDAAMAVRMEDLSGECF